MSPGNRTKQKRAVLIRTVAGFLLAAIALIAWAVSSPVGSSPDDDFHLPSIWCALGDREGLCQDAIQPTERVVSEEIAGVPCFAGDSAESAACAELGEGVKEAETLATGRVNSIAALYPPVFYFVLGLFASENIQLSVVLMRVFTSVLFVGIVGALYALLPRNRRSDLLLPLFVTLVPLGLFVVASTNPSSWALLSAGTLWIALVGFFETNGWRRIGLGAVSVIVAVLGAGARSDAAAFVVVAAGIASVLSFHANRRYLISLILPVALSVMAVLFYLSGSQSEAAFEGVNGVPPATIDTIVVLVLKNFLEIPALWAGVFGTWGLGWLDTDLPAAVWFAGIGIFSVAVAFGLRSLSRRKATALLLAFFTITAVPMVLLVQSQAFVGEYIQPRYILPALMIFAGVALFGPGASAVRPSNLQLAVGIGALSLANSVSLYTNLRRYVTGDDLIWPNLNAAVEWWWNAGVSPMMVWMIGSCAFVAVLVIAAYPAWCSGRKGAVERAEDPPIAVP